MSGGTIADYVDGDQTTAVVAANVDFGYSKKIRCFVRYGPLLRQVDASPHDSVLTLLKFTFFVCGLFLLFILDIAFCKSHILRFSPSDC